MSARKNRTRIATKNRTAKRTERLYLALSFFTFFSARSSKKTTIGFRRYARTAPMMIGESSPSIVSTILRKELKFVRNIKSRTAEHVASV